MALEPAAREKLDARTIALAVGALGVVYGDIGTNPLFALREAFQARHHVGVSEANVLLASVRHNDALHEQVLVISVTIEKRPRVPLVKRAQPTISTSRSTKRSNSGCRSSSR